MRRTCLNDLFELAKKDSRILFLGSDLGCGTLDAMKETLPDQFFMEGIAEQNLIGMAAGLAMEGYIPYVNTIATFLTRRCYEQIAVDLCLQNLPVRLIGNGGGLVYAPLGPTHTTLEDIAIMRALPNMRIIAPCDAQQMHALLPQTVQQPGPLYIRLGKGGDPLVERSDQAIFGQCQCLYQSLQGAWGEQGVIITTGIMAWRAVAVAEQLQKQGIFLDVLQAHTIKPLDQTTILSFIKKRKTVFTLEEHGRIGGLGDAVSDLLSQHPQQSIKAPKAPIRLAFPDQFAKGYGSQDYLLEKYGFSVEKLKRTIRQHYQQQP
ncbi:transketolase family protein [Magnetococcales bacterium HHB-1]